MPSSRPALGGAPPSARGGGRGVGPESLLITPVSLLSASGGAVAWGRWSRACAAVALRCRWRSRCGASRRRCGRPWPPARASTSPRAARGGRPRRSRAAVRRPHAQVLRLQPVLLQRPLRARGAGRGAGRLRRLPGRWSRPRCCRAVHADQVLAAAWRCPPGGGLPHRARGGSVAGPPACARRGSRRPRRAGRRATSTPEGAAAAGRRPRRPCAAPEQLASGAGRATALAAPRAAARDGGVRGRRRPRRGGAPGRHRGHLRHLRHPGDLGHARHLGDRASRPRAPARGAARAPGASSPPGRARRAPAPCHRGRGHRRAAPGAPRGRGRGCRACGAPPRGRAARAARTLRVVVAAVDHHVGRAPQRVLRGARPGDHRAGPGAALLEEVVLPLVAPDRLHDLHLVADAPPSRGSPIEPGAELGVEPARAPRCTRVTRRRRPSLPPPRRLHHPAAPRLAGRARRRPRRSGVRQRPAADPAAAAMRPRGRRPRPRPGALPRPGVAGPALRAGLGGRPGAAAAASGRASRAAGLGPAGPSASRARRAPRPRGPRVAGQRRLRSALAGARWAARGPGPAADGRAAAAPARGARGGGPVDPTRRFTCSLRSPFAVVPTRLTAAARSGGRLPRIRLAWRSPSRPGSSGSSVAHLRHHPRRLARLHLPEELGQALRLHRGLRRGRGKGRPLGRAAARARTAAATGSGTAGVRRPAAPERRARCAPGRARRPRCRRAPPPRRPRRRRRARQAVRQRRVAGGARARRRVEAVAGAPVRPRRKAATATIRTVFMPGSRSSRLGYGRAAQRDRVHRLAVLLHLLACHPSRCFSRSRSSTRRSWLAGGEVRHALLHLRGRLLHLVACRGDLLVERLVSRGRGSAAGPR